MAVGYTCPISTVSTSPQPPVHVYPPLQHPHRQLSDSYPTFPFPVPFSAMYMHVPYSFLCTRPNHLSQSLLSHLSPMLSPLHAHLKYLILSILLSNSPNEILSIFTSASSYSASCLCVITTVSSSYSWSHHSLVSLPICFCYYSDSVNHSAQNNISKLGQRSTRIFRDNCLLHLVYSIQKVKSHFKLYSLATVLAIINLWKSLCQGQNYKSLNVFKGPMKCKCMLTCVDL